MRCCIFIIGLVLPTWGWAAVTGEEFEAYVTGKTLTYADDGVIYGREEYLPNRRVRWAFEGDQCQEGFWYEAGEEICFVYEYDPGVTQCWTFDLKGGRLNAYFVGEDGGRRLYETGKSTEPLTCLGPDVGV